MSFTLDYECSWLPNVTSARWHLNYYLFICIQASTKIVSFWSGFSKKPCKFFSNNSVKILKTTFCQGHRYLLVEILVLQDQVHGRNLTTTPQQLILLCLIRLCSLLDNCKAYAYFSENASRNQFLKQHVIRNTHSSSTHAPPQFPYTPIGQKERFQIINPTQEIDI